MYVDDARSEYEVGWVLDEESSGCMWCDRGFTNFRRRHHCRACGLLVCDDCSTHRLPIKGLRPGRHRVCDTCYDGARNRSPVYATDDGYDDMWRRQEQEKRRPQYVRAPPHQPH